jgi:predicted transposase YdaD
MNMVYSLGHIPEKGPNMAEFDIVCKQLIQTYPADFVRFTLGQQDVEVLEVIETEQPVVETRQTDSFIRVRIQGKEALVHNEFQTGDSTQTPMPRRMAGYIGRGIEKQELPILSNVTYLRPDAGETDPGHYIQDLPGYRIIIEYKVWRLIEIEGQAVLDTPLVGLIPFAPLMKPPEGIVGVQWLRRCVQTADELPLDRPSKANFLTDLAVLSGLIHESQTIIDIISEETMYESSIVQHFTERAILQGQRQQSIEYVLRVLRIRFDPTAVETLKPAIETIEDLQSLDQLLHSAVQTSNLDEFKQTLVAMTNGK